MQFLSLIIILGYSTVLQQPANNFWQVLAEVSFKKEIKNNYEVEVPQFSNHLKSWNGKRIKLKGFIIPVGETGDQQKFMFSSLPFNVCYFCGAAGPETVVEVETTQKLKFTTKPIWMEGILQLNASNIDRHMYILKTATIISHE